MEAAWEVLVHLLVQILVASVGVTAVGLVEDRGMVTQGLLQGLQEVRCREPDEEDLGIQEEEGGHHSQVGQCSWAELEDLQGREVSLTSLLSER